MLKRVEMKVVLNVYDEEVRVDEVPKIAAYALDRGELALAEDIEVVRVTEEEDEPCSELEVWSMNEEFLNCYIDDFAGELLKVFKEYPKLEEACEEVCHSRGFVWDLRLGEQSRPFDSLAEEEMQGYRWLRMSKCVQAVAMDKIQSEDFKELGIEDMCAPDDVAFYLSMLGQLELCVCQVRRTMENLENK